MRDLLEIAVGTFVMVSFTMLSIFAFAYAAFGFVPYILQ